jgi:hypothetical protein
VSKASGRFFALFVIITMYFICIMVQLGKIEVLLKEAMGL